MWFLGLGIVGLVLKFMEIGFVGRLSWWIVLIPFALAAAWWAYADWSGYTKRRVIEKESRRREERDDRRHSRLGTLAPRGKKRR
ncbi:MAG: TIGR04438 family Trp-rich protein [Janthinobacterium lividum]